MLDNTISLCMIVKNEEKNIKRCLESVYNMVDEIIIVDTGSTDKTIKIAENYGAKIFYHKWNNNFSDARNISLQHATKNWILFLDADEEIEYEEGLKLKNILSLNPNLEGFHLRLVNIISNTDVGDAIVLRVFKNKDQYRFEGKMHEQIVGSIERYGGRNSVGATDVKIKHYGYDPALADIAQKQKRNLDLLNSYPNDKRDGYFYYSLGNEYARINEHQKALDTYYKALDISIPKGEKPVYLAYLYLHIAKVLNSSKRYNEELKMLKVFQNNYKDFKDLYFMESLAWIECNKPTNAKIALEKYLNCSSSSYEYPCSNFEKHYDMSKLLQSLETSKIEHKNKLLSVLILCYEDDPTLVETIKSINEISDEVIISTPSTSNLDRKKIENIGATIVDVKNEDEKNIFMRGYFKCSSQFILLMKPKEICSLDSQKKLVDFLSNTNNKYFNISIVDTNKNFISSEFRLFENDKALKKIKNFDDLASYIYSNNIQTENIYLHKIQ